VQVYFDLGNRKVYSTNSGQKDQGKMDQDPLTIEVNVNYEKGPHLLRSI